MIEQILPASVAVSESFGDLADVVLFPEEEALVRRAVPGRVREFATGRHCARQALRALGGLAAPIGRTARGAPRWPASVRGSITHCAGYRVAAVAHARDVTAIGVDAEPNQPVPEGVLNVIALPEEREWIEHLQAGRPHVHWGRLLFSAKESIYKTWHPATGRPLGFMDAVVSVDPWTQTFSARLRGAVALTVEPRQREYTGRWLVRRGLVVTAIAVEAPDLAPVGIQTVSRDGVAD